MLQELHVKNLGPLEEAGVEFCDGLNVITGETGTGKTLLLTSLQLLIGGRGDARLVGSAGGDATVEAVVSAPEGMRAGLAERGLDAGEDVVISRRVGSDGRSRAWMGGRLVPVSTLAELCGELVEMHGQGAAFALARPAAQLSALDAIGGHGDLVGEHRAKVRELRELEAEAEALRADERARARELDLLAFQADEIERAALEEGEDERIAAEIARLEHAERLWSIGARVVELCGNDGAAGRLAEAHRALEDAGRIDATVRPIVTRLAALAAEAAEATWDVRGWGDAMEPDPLRLETLRERASLIATMKRKYDVSIAGIIAAGSAARARLDDLRRADDRIADLDARTAGLSSELDALATDLSVRRRTAAAELAELVAAELPALALPDAVFDVRCEPADQRSESGRDKVEFVFSASSSRPADALARVASGGELSRAMIALTVSLAGAHAIPVLVFDEADQGIGGEAALELARRLQRLGRTHQVLVVTHLPQIAAFADRHIAVRKTSSGVEVEALDGDRRVAEVSRMLAGLESSDAARAHANELVRLASAELARAG